MDTKTIIEKAGGAAAVARLFDISTQAVSQWEEIPVKRCKRIEEATGGTVTCHQMRPEFFGPSPSTAKRKAAA